MTSQASVDLVEQATAFGDRTTRFLRECFTNAPALELTTSNPGASLIITPVGQTEKRGGVPLEAQGTRLASLRMSFLCRMDSTSTFLAIDKSKIWIVAEVDSTPIFRFEYLYEAGWVPRSHIQIHGDRGALAHLLSRTGHSKPHSMSALHLPTGGAQFRPNLEDVVQFLIVECKFDALETWKEAVDRERAEWRRIQTRTVCRNMPGEAAIQLRRMGYEVTPPSGGDPEPSRRALSSW